MLTIYAWLSSWILDYYGGVGKPSLYRAWFWHWWNHLKLSLYDLRRLNDSNYQKFHSAQNWDMRPVPGCHTNISINLLLSQYHDGSHSESRPKRAFVSTWKLIPEPCNIETKHLMENSFTLNLILHKPHLTHCKWCRLCRETFTFQYTETAIICSKINFVITKLRLHCICFFLLSIFVWNTCPWYTRRSSILPILCAVCVYCEIMYAASQSAVVCYLIPIIV